MTPARFRMNLLQEVTDTLAPADPHAWSHTPVYWGQDQAPWTNAPTGSGAGEHTGSRDG
jgi:hypothetical protein